MDGVVSESCARGAIKAAEVHQDNGMRGWKGNKPIKTNIISWRSRPKIENLQSAQDLQSRSNLKQIWVLVKSRVPEFVEPKQLKQTRVLVKRARLTAKRSTARPNARI